MKGLSKVGSFPDILECSRIVDILANAKRLEIISILYQGELCVTELARRIGMSQSALSQHLAKMRAAGVVVSRRDKLLVYYRLAMPKIIDLLDEVARFLKSNPSPHKR